MGRRNRRSSLCGPPRHACLRNIAFAAIFSAVGLKLIKIQTSLDPRRVSVSSEEVVGHQQPETPPLRFSPPRVVPRVVEMITKDQGGQRKDRPSRADSGFGHTNMPPPPRFPHDDYYDAHRARPLGRDECVAAAPWQERRAIWNCNDVHVLGFETANLVGRGSSRHVWRVHAEGEARLGSNHEGGEVVALKTLRAEEKDWTKDIYMSHFLEASAMAEMVASQFILEIYGFCGTSGLFEYTSGIDMRRNIEGGHHRHGKESQTGKHPVVRPEETLRHATEVALAVSDSNLFMQQADGTYRATLLNTDLKPQQFILHNGVYRLGDFNLACPLLLNTTSGKTCYAYDTAGYRGKHGSSFHAPEEYIADAGVTEKADVYVLGNLLYYLLEGKYPFQGEKKSKIDKIVKGERPKLPKYVSQSSHLAWKGIADAIRKCWVRDPEKRPSSLQIAAGLQKVQERLKK